MIDRVCGGAVVAVYVIRERFELFKKYLCIEGQRRELGKVLRVLLLNFHIFATIEFVLGNF